MKSLSAGLFAFFDHLGSLWSFRRLFLTLHGILSGFLLWLLASIIIILLGSLSLVDSFHHKCQVFLGQLIDCMPPP